MRSAQSQANNAAKTAGNTAGAYQNAAQAENAQLTPFYQKGLNTEHLFTPEDQQELLTAAGAGAGGSTVAGSAEANQQAARTRNSANSTVLDALKQNEQKTLASGSENIAAEDVTGAKKLNQASAAGLGEMYGENTDAALKAMNIQNADINSEIEAGKSGWYQNMTGLLNSLKGAGTSKFTV